MKPVKGNNKQRRTKSICLFKKGPFCALSPSLVKETNGIYFLLLKNRKERNVETKRRIREKKRANRSLVHYHHAAIGSLSIFPLSLLLHCIWLSVFRSLFSIWATRSSSCWSKEMDGLVNDDPFPLCCYYNHVFHHLY